MSQIPHLNVQAVAGNILEFLQENPRYSRVVVHGFSVGAFLFCQVKIKVNNDDDDFPNSLVRHKEGAQGEEEEETAGRRNDRNSDARSGRSRWFNSVRGVGCEE